MPPESVDDTAPWLDDPEPGSEPVASPPPEPEPLPGAELEAEPQAHEWPVIPAGLRPGVLLVLETPWLSYDGDLAA